MEIRKKILIVDDEPGICYILETVLKSAGFDVKTAATGAAALTVAESNCPDVVLLDLGLPDMDGMDVLCSLRAWAKVPVIVVSARGNESAKVAALENGADDYISKPFGTQELLARIRVITRNKDQGYASVHTLADLKVDSAARTVYRRDREIELSPKEFALLEYMIINKGKVLSREAIEDHIYDVDYEGGSNVVNVYIRFLRRKIDEPFEKKLIHTVRGSGYVLKEE